MSIYLCSFTFMFASSLDLIQASSYKREHATFNTSRWMVKEYLCTCSFYKALDIAKHLLVIKKITETKISKQKKNQIYNPTTYV